MLWGGRPSPTSVLTPRPCSASPNSLSASPSTSTSTSTWAGLRGARGGACRSSWPGGCHPAQWHRARDDTLGSHDAFSSTFRGEAQAGPVRGVGVPSQAPFSATPNVTGEFCRGESSGRTATPAQDSTAVRTPVCRGRRGDPTAPPANRGASRGQGSDCRKPNLEAPSALPTDVWGSQRLSSQRPHRALTEAALTGRGPACCRAPAPYLRQPQPARQPEGVLRPHPSDLGTTGRPGGLPTPTSASSHRPG